MEREELGFSCGGEPCAAWLYPATSDAARAPIVVIAHGISGTRRDVLQL